MTEFTKQIIADADDGVSFGSTYYSSSGLAIGSGPRECVFRFTNVTIPKDTVINSAIIRFTANTSRSGTTVNLDIGIEAADNPSAPTNETQFNSQSSNLGSTVDWDGVGGWTAESTYDTPGLASIFTTHFARTGWASGQALNLFIMNDGSSDYRQPYGYDADPAKTAELIITYDTLGSIADSMTIDDSVDAFSLTDDISDSFSIDDLVSAQGGSTFATVSDSFTIDDSILAEGGSTFATTADGFTIDDLVEAGGEFNVDLDDSFTIGDSVASATEYNSIDIADSFAIDDSADAFLWSEWIRENYGKYVIRYYVTLTGDADGLADIELPHSSFQATKRDGDPTYLSVIVPGSTYVSQINARSNGDIKVDMAYLVGGEESFRENILWVDLETIRTDEGPRRFSITLSGSRVYSYGSNLVLLENPTYKNVSDGKIRYRFLQANPWLNPGDVVQCRTDEFVVDFVTYNISRGFKQMEVSET